MSLRFGNARKKRVSLNVIYISNFYSSRPSRMSIRHTLSGVTSPDTLLADEAADDAPDLTVDASDGQPSAPQISRASPNSPDT